MRCPACGQEIAAHLTQCPNCGLPQQVQQPYQSPYPNPAPTYQSPGQYPNQPVRQPRPTPYYAQMPSAAPREVTPTGTWMLWHLLNMFLPVIGPIIMACTCKDPTAKNYGKAKIVFDICWLALMVAAIMLFAGLVRSFLSLR